MDRHLQDKIDRFRRTDLKDWRWWQVDDDLIVERPLITSASTGFTPRTLIYYLPYRNWAIVKGVHFPSLGSEWPWYVHIGDISFHRDYDCWVLTDLFCDVIVKDDGHEH